MKNTKNLKTWMAKSLMFSAAFIMATTGCSSDPNISILPSVNNFAPDGSQITAKMDILWVIDNSGSMQPYQAELQAQFQNFITEFVGNDYDFRMAVTTTDGNASFTPAVIVDGGDGTRTDDDTFTIADAGASFIGNQTFTNNSSTCPVAAQGTQTQSSDFWDGNQVDGVSGFPLISSMDSAIDFSLTPIGSDPNSADDIESIFNQNIAQGICGSGTEAGLESMVAALKNASNQALMVNGETLPFPRPDAHLAIIMVTDEEDTRAVETSPGVFANAVNNVPVSVYDDYLTSISSESLGYSFHTIGVLAGQVGSIIPASSPQRRECLTDGTPNGQDLHPAASETTRYPALSALSGGIVSSVCSPFADTLQNIAQTIIQTTTEFKLVGTPSDPNALIVRVKNPGEDFMTIAQDPVNGWTYNASSNSITFNGTSAPQQGAEISIVFDPNSL